MLEITTLLGSSQNSNWELHVLHIALKKYIVNNDSKNIYWALTVSVSVPSISYELITLFLKAIYESNIYYPSLYMSNLRRASISECLS